MYIADVKEPDKFEIKVTSKYLNGGRGGANSRGVLLRMSVGRVEVKTRNLCVMIMYLHLFGLIFRRKDSQDDISEMSDCTESKGKVEQKRCERRISSSQRISVEKEEV